MNWKDKLDEAVKAIRNVAESDTVKNLVTKARDTAMQLGQKVRQGAVNAAEAFIEANADPSTLTIRYLNADCKIVSPSDHLEIKRPHGGTLVISDGAGNGLVVTPATFLRWHRELGARKVDVLSAQLGNTRADAGRTAPGVGRTRCKCGSARRRVGTLLPKGSLCRPGYGSSSSLLC